MNFYRYLATGESFTSQHYQFRLGERTISYFVENVCQILWDILQPLEMAVPDTAKYKEIADRFEELWQVRFSTTTNNISLSCCKVLLMLTGASYLLMLAIMEDRQNDAAVFKNSSFGKALNEKRCLHRSIFQEATSQHLLFS